MRDSNVFHLQSFGAASLFVVRRPRGGDGLSDDIRAFKAAGVEELVSMLTAEEQADLNLLAEGECCEALGIRYLSVPIADFSVPSDSSIFENALAKAIRRLSEGNSVAVHCRQSIGRSGLFACAVLIGMGIPVEEAIAMASTARGLPVPETNEQRAWLEKNADKFSRLNARGSDCGARGV